MFAVRRGGNCHSAWEVVFNSKETTPVEVNGKLGVKLQYSEDGNICFMQEKTTKGMIKNYKVGI